MTRYICAFLAALLLIPGTFAQQAYRLEKDLRGEKQIPADAYYGVQTARALENFPISGALINHYPGFVEAWAIVKLTAARANTDVGALKPEKLAAIEKACQAAHQGQLQLNAYEPLEGLAVIESQSLLFRTSNAFRTKCVDGITVNEKTLEHYMETTVGIVTALNPIIGYEKATELANEAYKSGKGILEIIWEKKVLTEQEIKDLLDPVKLTGLDRSKYKK